MKSYLYGMPRLLLFPVIYLFPLLLHSQSTTAKRLWIIGTQFNVGEYVYDKTGVVEFGCKFGKVYTNFYFPNHRNYASTGLEFNFNRHFFLGPKLTYEYNVGCIAARSEFTWFTDFSRSDPRFGIGGGLSVFGFFGLSYMYQPPIVKAPVDVVYVHKLSITLRIPLKISQL